MPTDVRQVEYFYTTVTDRPGEAYRLLSRLASDKVSLLAFDAIPIGIETAQILMLPESAEGLLAAAEKAGIDLKGPEYAFLIQGDDQVGALTDLHRKLFDAEINVYASTGVSDGRGGYGYVLYVRSENFRDAARVLGCKTPVRKAVPQAKHSPTRTPMTPEPVL